MSAYMATGTHRGLSGQTWAHSLPHVSARFLGLRKDKVVERHLFPKRKPRHPKQDLRELARKAEESYLDFQDVPQMAFLICVVQLFNLPQFVVLDMLGRTFRKIEGETQVRKQDQDCALLVGS